MKTTYLIVIILLISCGDRLGAGVEVSTNIRIYFSDSEGKNILGADNSNAAFKLEDLNLFYYDQEMKFVKRYDEHLDAPKHISTYLERDGLLGMSPLFGTEDGTYVEGGISTTYLDFGNGDIDTIEVSGIIDKGRTIIRDVWYNGVLVVESTETEFNKSEFAENGFTVIK